VCLARYGGLRVPSESHALTWADIDWQRKRIRVPSVKTARHPGHEAREIPLFPELERPLLEAWEVSPEGEPHVIYGIGAANPGTHLRRLIAKAGLPALPKPWINLRASRATELAETFPSHVAAAWLGHSIAVANEHYRMVREEHFQKAVQKAVQQTAEWGGNVMNAGSGTLPETPVFPLFSARCDIVHNCLLGDGRLERPQESPGNTQVFGAGGAKSGAPVADSPTPAGLPAGVLAKLAEVWPSLPEAVRVALAQAMGPTESGKPVEPYGNTRKSE